MLINGQIKEHKIEKKNARIIYQRECEPVYRLLIITVHDATCVVMLPLGGGFWQCIHNPRALWGLDRGLFIF